MRIRHIQTETKTIAGKPVVVPVLDDQGQEIELWSVEVPRAIAANGIPAHIDSTSKDALEAYIAEESARIRAQADGEG